MTVLSGMLRRSLLDLLDVDAFPSSSEVSQSRANASADSVAKLLLLSSNMIQNAIRSDEVESTTA